MRFSLSKFQVSSAKKSSILTVYTVWPVLSRKLKLESPKRPQNGGRPLLVYWSLDQHLQAAIKPLESSMRFCWYPPWDGLVVINPIIFIGDSVRGTRDWSAPDISGFSRHPDSLLVKPLSPYHSSRDDAFSFPGRHVDNPYSSRLNAVRLGARNHSNIGRILENPCVSEQRLRHANMGSGSLSVKSLIQRFHKLTKYIQNFLYYK